MRKRGNGCVNGQGQIEGREGRGKRKRMGGEGETGGGRRE